MTRAAVRLPVRMCATRELEGGGNCRPRTPAAAIPFGDRRHRTRSAADVGTEPNRRRNPRQQALCKPATKHCAIVADGIAVCIDSCVRHRKLTCLRPTSTDCRSAPPSTKISAWRGPTILPSTVLRRHSNTFWIRCLLLLSDAHCNRDTPPTDRKAADSDN